MSKHTPEPWKLWGDKEAVVMDCPLHSKHGFIAVMACNEDVSAKTSSANAKRIVTCVNACAGMSDPAAEIAELKRQRDELLAALNYARDYLGDIPARGMVLLGLISVMNKNIDTAKGSAS